MIRDILNHHHVLFLLAGVCILFGVANGDALAQDAAPNSGEVVAAEDAEADNEAEEVAEDTSVKPDDIQSLFFVYWEYEALMDAKRSRGSSTPLASRDLPPEITEDPSVLIKDTLKPPPGSRELKLGGILFVSTDDWVIWLNNKRVTPKAVPNEVVDIRVYDSFIELKWLDEWSGKIFPVKLKPHQRFNMDRKIFLPG